MDGDKQFSDVVIRFSNQVEDIIAFLFCKEEQLQKRPDLVALQDAPFNQVLDEYSQHEKFMTEICEYCHTIMKCKEEGQELKDNIDDLNKEDRDEVGIQMDAMLVLHEKLKIIITDRLHNLQRIVEERQRSQIERLEKWLTSMENRLASSHNIGPDHEALQRQMLEIDELKNELEQKQEFLNIVSRVIIFDDVDLESSQLRSRSCESLENQLENMNYRWTKICQVVNDRHERLKKAESIWKLLHLEGPQLASWLRKIQLALDELSGATRNITDPQTEKPFLSKLVTRSEKLDSEMKSKQSFYTSLENRVRVEIQRFDDPCSMFVIELEKKLEDMQEHWNSIMRQKRMIDFSLQALSSPDAISNNTARPIIPVPDSITAMSDNEIKFDGDMMLSPDGQVHNQDACNELLTNSSSTGHDDLDSSPHLNDSLSDSRAFENSTSSQDTRSLMYSNNNNGHRYQQDPLASLNDNDSHDELSSATNLTSPQHGNIYPTRANIHSEYPYLNHDEYGMNGKFLDLSQSATKNTHDENHSRRIGEWKHSLESFSNWLRQVEMTLGILDHQAWLRLNLQDQIALVQDVESKIITTCQDEFDCLFLQGQQIIEDFMSDIGENQYDSDSKKLLADIEFRYNAVKRCLIDRERELADKEKWRRLSRNLQDACQFLVTRMGDVIPETEIGVDLITLAQQQDQLMHSKEELAANSELQSSILEAKLFLKLCDSLQQQYGQKHSTDNQSTSNFIDIWLSFKDYKDEIEKHLDGLSVHYSELSQMIEDRLARLDQVHKEMHALQHCIQDLATKLQVAEILKSNWVPLENLSIEQLSEQLEDLKSYRERLGEVESIHKEMNSIVDWMDRFDAPLSQSNMKRIDELNDIWLLIQSNVEERQKQIELAFDEQSCSEQKFLVETVSDLSGWERRVATSKVPYFLNRESKKTHWDHPKFTSILESMEECKQYVFSAYRTAMKLRIVQKSLGIDKLMLEQLRELFNHFDLTQAVTQRATNSNFQINNNRDNHSVQTNSLGKHDTFVGVEQIILLLKAVFESLQGVEASTLDVPTAIDLMLNWLLNLYDSTRTGQVSILSLKVGLTLICCATREEKYIYMYELVASQNNGLVDAKKLGALFEICMRIPTYLGESESFGGSDLIESSIRQCFVMAKFNPQRPNCIELNDYLNWLKTEPQFIIWLPVLHRLLISESTTHPMKCKLCRANPIVGLRYRCLKCFKFNICQKCFLTGRHITEHPDPMRHPLREYCCASNMSDQVRDLSRIFRSAFI